MKKSLRRFMLTNGKYPPNTEGWVGLRHLYTGAASYKNFKLSVPEELSD
jgi:hypothetical protein